MAERQEDTLSCLAIPLRIIANTSDKAVETMEEYEIVLQAAAVVLTISLRGIRDRSTERVTRSWDELIELYQSARSRLCST